MDIALVIIVWITAGIFCLQVVEATGVALRKGKSVKVSKVQKVTFVTLVLAGGWVLLAVIFLIAAICSSLPLRHGWRII